MTSFPLPSRRLVAALVALGLVRAVPLSAQLPRDSAATVRLEEIVVTATRLPLPRAAVASAVTVLTGDELRARGITNLLDALRDVPGAAVAQSGSFGAPASLFLRGGESDYVRVLVDGVPVNAPGGAFDAAHLTTDGIERIEVVRGPASVLYGSDAVAGVVQVFTRSGVGVPRARAEVSAGTFGTSRVLAEASGGTPRLGVTLWGSRFASDGTYPVNSAYHRSEVAGRLHVVPDGRTEAALTLRRDVHRAHFPTDGAGRITDLAQATTGAGTTAGLDVRRAVGPRFEVRLLLASRVADQGYDDPRDGPADTTGAFYYASLGRESRHSADLRAVTWLRPGTVLSVGGTLEREAVRSRDSADGEWGPSASAFAARRRNRAAYAQLVAEAGRGISLEAGARIDRNERFGTFATSRLGASWRVLGAARLRAAAGTALKEPTFFENDATGFVRGNPDLRPERSRSLEVGGDADLAGGRASFAVTLFTQRFADLIQYTFVPPAPDAPNYFNVAAARSAGVELELSARLAPGLTARARYLYLSTRVLRAGFEQGPDAAFAEGRRLLRRPVHAAGVTLGAARGGAALEVSADLVGRRDDLDFSGLVPARVALPAHLRLDGAAAVPLLAGRRSARGLTATLRAENLLGAGYEDVRGFPARGRTLLLGIRAEGGW